MATGTGPCGSSSLTVNPHGKIRPSTPRAAYSHSRSVGSRAPRAAQKACAWACVTQVCGTLPATLAYRAGTSVLALVGHLGAVQSPSVTQAA